MRVKVGVRLMRQVGTAVSTRQPQGPLVTGKGQVDVGAGIHGVSQDQVTTRRMSGQRDERPAPGHPRIQADHRHRSSGPVPDMAPGRREHLNRGRLGTLRHRGKVTDHATRPSAKASSHWPDGRPMFPPPRVGPAISATLVVVDDLRKPMALGQLKR